MHQIHDKLRKCVYYCDRFMTVFNKSDWKVLQMPLTRFVNAFARLGLCNLGATAALYVVTVRSLNN